MKDRIVSLYSLLGVSEDCTDEQLRRAYLTAMKRHHPDVNHGDVAAATAMTQQITEAFVTLINHRRQHMVSESVTDVESVDAFAGFSEFFDDADSETNEGIHSNATARKSELQLAYDVFCSHPNNVWVALCLIHAAIACEREDTINDLLTNPIMIDSANDLYSLMDSQSASSTLDVWQVQLGRQGMHTERIAMLEDAVATGQASDGIKNTLRKQYYQMSKGEGLPERAESSFETRIEYLMKIVELGNVPSYIYKHLAKAHYDNGDQITARAMLSKAYEIDPRLPGAVRISHMLGITPPDVDDDPHGLGPSPWDQSARNKRAQSRRKNGPYPTLDQARQWANNKKWDPIIAMAQRTDYDAKERKTMLLAAQALGGCFEPGASSALVSLTESHYWDVQIAAYVSLATVGGLSALESLRQRRANGQSEARYLGNCIEYLSYRLCVHNPLDLPTDRERRLEQGRRAFSDLHMGQARFLLEQALELGATPQEQSTAQLVDDGHLQDARFLLARACAEMGDTERAIRLTLPVFDYMPPSKKLQVRHALMDWLWSYLVFASYDPINDHLYVLALALQVDMALSAHSAGDFLYAVKYLTRWLELVGAEGLVSWVRTQVGDAAPGYGELRRGASYLHRGTKRSDSLQSELDTLERRLKVELPKKLQQMFNTDATIDARQFLLDE